MSNCSPVTTYKLFSSNTSRLSRAALLACGLGVLQACSGTDAVAPREGRTPAPGPVVSRVSRVTADTVQAGRLLTLEGEGFPAGPSGITVTLDGVVLTVRAVTNTRLEVDVPASAFPCRGTRVVSLRVTLPTSSFAAEIPLRVATQVQLKTGETSRLLGAQASACVELSAPAGSASARYVVAMVNTQGSDSAPATIELRGGGTGNLAGVTGTVTAVPQAFTAPVMAPSAVAPAMHGDAAHDAGLAMDRQRVAQAGSAVQAWQRTGLPGRMAALSRPLQAGDTTTVTALSTSCHAGRAIRSRVVYAGTRALVLEDIAAASAGVMDAHYRQIGEEFDRVVYPLLERQVGNPLAMNSTMGGDGRVTMLFTRFVNDSLPGTAGYVSACNFYPRSTFAGSNQDELLYGRVPGAYETPDEWRRAMRATVVHEAKHLASFAERLAGGVTFEEPWLEEATARVAEELYARTFQGGGAWQQAVGFASSVGCELTQCDDRPLIMWKHFSGLHSWLKSANVQPVGQVSASNGAALSATAANAGYSSGWALVRWVLDSHTASETTALRALVSGRAGVGAKALAAVAAQSEDELLAGWAISLGVQGDAGMNAGTISTTSWQVNDILRGMATMFPGVFTARPLPMTGVSFGEFALPRQMLSGTASYAVLDGSLSGATQLLELRGSRAAGAATVGLVIARTR